MIPYEELTETQKWAVECFGALPGLTAEGSSGGPFADPADEWNLAIKPVLTGGAPTVAGWRSLSWLVWLFTDAQRGHMITHGEQIMDMYPHSGGDGAADPATSLCIVVRASESLVPLDGLAHHLIRCWRESSQAERHPQLVFPEPKKGS